MGLTGLVALIFIATGAMKLSDPPRAVAEFDQIGLGQGFRLFTGLVEVGVALLMRIPRTSPGGAGLLLCVSVGALIAQATRLRQDVVHTIVLMALTGALVWAGRRRLPALGEPI